MLTIKALDVASWYFDAAEHFPFVCIFQPTLPPRSLCHTSVWSFLPSSLLGSPGGAIWHHLLLSTTMAHWDWVSSEEKMNGSCPLQYLLGVSLAAMNEATYYATKSFINPG